MARFALSLLFSVTKRPRDPDAETRFGNVAPCIVRYELFSEGVAMAVASRF